MKTRNFFEIIESKKLEIRSEDDCYVVFDFTDDIAKISKTEVGKFTIYNDEGQIGSECETVKEVINTCVEFSYTPINERGQIVYVVINKDFDYGERKVLKLHGVFSDKKKAEAEIYEKDLFQFKIYEFEINESRPTFLVELSLYD